MKKVLILTVIIFFLANICQVSVASEQRYLRQRNYIIKSDNYKIAVKLTPEEKILDKKLDDMKKELIESYNGKFPYDFPTLKDKKLVESDLYHFSEKLPKGADLHVHGSELMPASGYFDYISKNEQVYICNQKGKKYGTIIYVQAGDIIPAGYIKFKDALTGKIFTKEQLLDLWTILPNEHTTQVDVWDKFEALFRNVDIVRYLESDSIRKYYYDAFKKYCENNILHIELHRTIYADLQKERRMELIIRQAYYDIKKEYPAFTLRIITTGFKNYSQDLNEDIKRLDITKKLQSEIKDDFDKNNVENFIIGYDLVNEEDSSRSLLAYSQYLEKYRSKDFNLYLHAGESLSTKNYNLVDAYLLKAKRVGHGYNLYMFPKLLDKYRKANIALEVCPISNIRLGYVSDLRQHPMTEYLKRGIPIVVSSDDPIFFEHKALVDDWFAIILAFDLNIAEIKQLCLNSILYSGLSKQEKAKLLSVWKAQWQIFLNEQISDNLLNN